MDSDQMANFLSRDKVQEIFKLLNIDQNTPEDVARQRIQQYLQSNQLIGQMYSAAASNIQQEPLIINKQNQRSGDANVYPVTQKRFGDRLIQDQPQQGQFLTVQITRSEAFSQPEMNGVLSLHLRAGQGRASSRSVSHTDSPAFCDVFSLKLSEQPETRTRLFQLLKHSPLEILVVNKLINGASRILGHATLDFTSMFERWVETHQIQLKSYGNTEEVSGILYLTIQLSPEIGFGQVPEQISQQKEEQLQTAIIGFRQEAKQLSDQYKYQCQIFQSELQNLRPGRKMYVALNLLRDDGKIVPSCTLVQPIYSKQLNTAHLCYRFCNLVPDASIEFSTQSTWARCLTTISRGSASEEDKAILLCSLLRGLQQPAFVAVGQTVQKTGFVCVVAIFGAKVQIYYKEEIYYFKQQTDGTYMLEDFSNNYPGSQTVELFDISCFDSFFNDQDLFVNLQQQLTFSQKVITNFSFHLTRPTLFKRFPAELLQQLSQKTELQPALSPFAPETAELCADALEQKLWQLIAARRADVGLSTPRSESLNRLLGTALPSYELEQLTGLNIGNEQFQLVVKNYVKQGEVFGAFPLQISGQLRFHAPSVFRAICQNEQGRKIVESVGDQLRMGLRVHVQGYAETVCAVWVIVGAVAVPVQ